MRICLLFFGSSKRRTFHSSASLSSENGLVRKERLKAELVACDNASLKFWFVLRTVIAHHAVYEIFPLDHRTTLRTDFPEARQGALEALHL